MMSKYTIKLIGFRIKVIKYCLGGVIGWDSKKKMVTRSHNFLYWTWLLHTTGGFIFSGVLATYLTFEMPDIEDVVEKIEDPKAIASEIIGWGEVGVTTTICLLACAITIHRQSVINLMNEYIRYNDVVLEMLQADGRKLKKEHKIMLRAGEVMMLAVNFFTTLLPISLGTVFVHPIEPTGRMIRAVYEIKLTFSLGTAPFLFVLGVLVYAASNAAVILVIMSVMNYSISMTCLKGMTPDQDEIPDGIIPGKRWDSKKRLVTQAHNFLYWTWLLHTAGGFMYGGLLAIYLTFEMAEIEDVVEKEEDPKAIASEIIGWGEVGGGITICLLACAITINRQNVINLMNEYIRYNDVVLEMLQSDGRKLKKEHKRLLRAGELMMLAVNFFTTLLPISLGTVFVHPIEPTGRMIQAIYEIKLTFTLGTAPFLFVLGVLIYAASNAAVILIIMSVMNYSISMTCLKGITPDQDEIPDGIIPRKRNKIPTYAFGVLEDTAVAQLYRVQRIFNTLLNEIEANLFISFHHVGCLLTVVSMAYFAIAFHDVVQDAGPVGYMAVFGSLCAALFLQFTESYMLGQIVDMGDDFEAVGKQVVLRRSYFRKVLTHYQKFYVQQAYPFFTIHKETFLMFCEQAQDNIINLLMGD
ncbi:unnamed protein product [Orchesella dallaii]|uniref:Odorant receptor n=1 Tax=Orchesella dallaii TaxID=48710 RepID=A0ABP1RR72_9HEXA